MAKRFHLPALDAVAMEMALDAYRAACEHQMRLEDKWEPKESLLSKLDEFHRTRVAHENAFYRSRALIERANEVMRAVSRSAYNDPARLFPPMWDTFSEEVLRKSKDRSEQRVLGKIDAVNAYVRKTVPEWAALEDKILKDRRSRKG